MKNLTITVIFLSLAFSATQNAAGPTHRFAVTEQQAISAVFNSIEQQDNTIVVKNRHHQATFDQHGIQFTPVQGPDWHWQIDDKQLKPASPVIANNAIDYVHKDYTERYLLKPDSIEQRFIITMPYQQEHDLVINGKIRSPGQFEATDNGWVWHNSQGVVSLGQVTVFDADGKILPATMHTEADFSRITVAASVLKTASYPVIIDPEIGSNDIRLSDMGPDGDGGFGAFSPAVSYNTTNNEYLVVWEGDDDTGMLVNNEREVFGQRIDAATGVEIGSDFRLSDMGPDGDANFNAHNPAVSYNTSNNEYLVVWEGSDNTGLLVSDESEIFGQRIDAATGAEIGSDVRLSDMGPDGDTNFNAYSPAVSYNTTNNEYLVVWEGSDNTGLLVSNELEIYGQRIDAATGAKVGSDVRLSDMGPDGDTNFYAYNPAVSYNARNNEYLVVWYGDDDTAPLVDNEFEIFGQRIDATTGAEVGDDVRLSDMGPDGDTNFNAYKPAVSYNTSNNEYLVVWSGRDDTGSLASGELEIFGQRINAATGTKIGNGVRLSDMGPDGDKGFGAFSSAVNYNASNNEYLVVWAGNDDSGSLVGNEVEIFGQRFAGPATLRFIDDVPTVVEDASSVQIEVQRVGDTSNTVTVDFTTANGSAIAPADYTTANGTLTFNAGESSKTFSIGITDNSDIDGDKTINLSLSNVQAVSGEVTLDTQRAAAILTITDNDVAAIDDAATTAPSGGGGGSALSLLTLLLLTLLMSGRQLLRV